jgi:hypothetical protein
VQLLMLLQEPLTGCCPADQRDLLLLPLLPPELLLLLLRLLCHQR